MKHWFFAFVVVVGLAWLYQDDVPGDLFDDPVAKHQAAQTELERAEAALQFHDDNRERLVEIQTLEVMSYNPGMSRSEARELAVKELDWAREDLVYDVQDARRRISQLP